MKVRITVILQVIVGIILVIFLARYLDSQWDEFQSVEVAFHPFWFGLAQLLFFIGMGSIPFGSSVVVQQLGGTNTYFDIWHTFFLSQVLKYLPGSLWALPSRAYLYHRRGLKGQAAVESVFWESGLLLVSAIALSILSIPLLQDDAEFTSVVVVLGAFLLAFFAGLVLLKTSQFQQLMTRIPFMNVSFRMSYRTLPKVLLSYTLTWSIIGLGFAFLGYAFELDLAISDVIALIGLFSASWAVGFLAFFTPGGIGVRDALLVLGMNQLADAPFPLAVAIAARICWTVSEIIGLGIMTVIYHRGNNRAVREDTSQIIDSA